MSNNEIIDSNEQLDVVRDLASHGFTYQQIGAYARIDSLEQLQERFGEEIAIASTGKNLEVAKSLFEMATKGKSVTAATFWLRCRNRWSVKQDNGISEDDVEPLFEPEPEDEE